jgi:hypothetical protein
MKNTTAFITIATVKPRKYESKFDFLRGVRLFLRNIKIFCTHSLLSGDNIWVNKTSDKPQEIIESFSLVSDENGNPKFVRTDGEIKGSVLGLTTEKDE